MEGFHAAGRPAGGRAHRARRRRGADRRTAGKAQAYTLRALAAGEPYPPGSLQFASLVKERAARWAAVPAPEQAAVRGHRRGRGRRRPLRRQRAPGRRARGRRRSPFHRRARELVGDAERLYVACARPGPLLRRHRRSARLADRRRQLSADQRRRAGGGRRVLALATDAQGTVYAISAEPDAQRPGDHQAAARPRAPAETDWQPLHARRAGAAAADRADRYRSRRSRRRDALWSACGRRRAGAGTTSATGAVEIDLGNGHSVQHRPPSRGRDASPPRRCRSVQPDRRAVRRRRDLVRVAGGREPLAGGAAAHLERERGPRQRARSTRSAAAATGRSGRRRRRGWRASTARAGCRSGPTELVDARPRDRRQGPGLGGDRQGAADAAGRAPRAGGADPGNAPVILAGDMRDVAADRFGRDLGAVASVDRAGHREATNPRRLLTQAA